MSDFILKYNNLKKGFYITNNNKIANITEIIRRFSTFPYIGKLEYDTGYWEYAKWNKDGRTYLSDHRFLNMPYYFYANVPDTLKYGPFKNYKDAYNFLVKI